jgi:hypothetical protein
VEPKGYDLASVRRRLARKDDPWADIAAHAASATSAHEQLKKLLAQTRRSERCELAPSAP